MQKPVREPGPDHPIDIQPTLDRVVVQFGGVTIADTTRALTLREADLAPVQYIPKADVRMDLLAPGALATRCPYKGEASHHSVTAGGRRSENAAWSYETPFSAVAEIAGHIAFYPERVDAIEVRSVGQ